MTTPKVTGVTAPVINKNLSTDSTVPTVAVDVQSAWGSWTNWGAVIGFLATIATLFGIDIDEDTQKALVGGISGAAAVFVIVRRTFFTKTVTPAAAGVGK